MPRTVRELYPHARVRQRLRVLEPGAVVDDDRPMRRFRRAVRAVLFLMIALPIAALTRSERSLQAGSAASGALTRWLFRISPAWVRWDGWARARGWMRTTELPDDPLIDGEHVALSAGLVPSYRAVVGPRRVPVHAVSLEVLGDDATHHGAYVMQVQLPAAVAARFPGSSLVRRQGLGLVGRDRVGGRALGLESIRLDEEAVLRIDGGDPLDWRMLLDPALVDLLADGVHVEWVQRGDRLLLHSPAPASSFRVPEPARMDALAVAAVAIERRMATIAGGGRAVPAAEAGWLVERSRASRTRHLRRERQRDLAMSIEDQLVELGRFASEDEVERVRAGMAAGTFRVDHLDDLIHHRRAAFWADGNAA